MLTPSEGICDRVRTSPRGPSSPVILFLPLSPLLHQSLLGLTLASFVGLTLLLLSLGDLLIPFLSFDTVQGGPSSYLFVFASHSLLPHIAHPQGPLGDSLTPRGSRGHLGVGDWRTLAVQPHGDGQRDICTGTGIHMAPHSSGLIALDEGTDWPLPMPAFTSFLASSWPLPTPAPINAVFGEESGHCWITLCTSPPTTLAEEVLTLGVNLGEADRIVSGVDEETVIVGIIPPATTQDEWEGDSTTKVHSSLPRSNKASKPARFGLIEVGKGIPGNWGRKG